MTLPLYTSMPYSWYLHLYSIVVERNPVFLFRYAVVLLNSIYMYDIYKLLVQFCFWIVD